MIQKNAEEHMRVSVIGAVVARTGYRCSVPLVNTAESLVSHPVDGKNLLDRVQTAWGVVDLLADGSATPSSSILACTGEMISVRHYQTCVSLWYIQTVRVATSKGVQCKRSGVVGDVFATFLSPGGCHGPRSIA